MNPTLIRRGALAAALAAAALAAPAAADAASLRLENGTLVFTAAPGLDNWPSFSQPAPGILRVSDADERFAPGGGCAPLDPEYPSDADCAMPARLRVELGDGNDRIMLRESLPPIPVEVLGQSGSDGLSANYDVDNHAVLDGGDGADTLTGHGFGETLVGGPGDDVLRGGAGGDVLRAGDGDDALEPDGAPDVQGDDVVDGGAGFDSVKDWGSTSTDPAFAVAVTVDSVADDGRPGERDNVTAVERFDALSPGRYVMTDAADSIDLPNFGTSSVEGRGGDDQITGNDGAESLDGGADADRLEGGYGHDRITGGPGRDTIYGDETSQRCSYLSDCAIVPFGNDTILARDGEADAVDCGVGNDRAVVDAVDMVANCERIEGADRPRSDEPRGEEPRRSTIGLARRIGLRKALRRGLPIKLAGLPAGRRRLVVRHGGRIVGKATVTLPASGRAEARVRFTPAARRALARRRSVKLVLSTPGARATITLR